ncbi:MAG: hypothetical protein ISS18_03120 [Bacteroidales bacterium]|nr:hypothetical protein [Bacteroidales bacterium]
MPTGFSRSPKLLKGAFVKLSDEFLVPIPNIIVFQYNPEKMTRSLSPSAETSHGDSSNKSSTTEPFDPNESFDLTLELDAADALEEPDTHPVAVISGVADRISAMEMLLYPTGESMLGNALSSVFGSSDVVPRGSVPVVLFVWGPGRILPVRLTKFSVEEQAFSPILYPIRASVSVSLDVLTDQSFTKLGRKLSASEEIAIVAYKFTRGQREVLALANIANSVESILGMLPF